MEKNRCPKTTDSPQFQMKMAASLVDDFEKGELAIFWEPQQNIECVHIDRAITKHGQVSFAEYEVTGLETQRNMKVARCRTQ